MKIVFMGTPEFAVPSLRLLAANNWIKIAAVVTAPDKPAGRGYKPTPSPVKIAANELGIPVLQPEKLRDPHFLKTLADLSPDLGVVIAFRMLPEVVWRIPTKGTINLHAALLPDYRGAAPINHVIIQGETQTGATTFFIDQQIDTGNILLQYKCPLPEDWNAGDLHDHLMIAGATLVLDTIKQIADNSITPMAQNPALALHTAPKLTTENCKINFDKTAKEVYNFIRGLSPYPGAWCVLDNKLLKILKAQYDTATDIELKTAAVIINKNATCPMIIGCKSGVLLPTIVQLEGKKRLEIADFIRGYTGNYIIH
jgi:methionyl-tRNA formyltransferase